MPPQAFEIKISERPFYVPGSGPPLAPISLLPDNQETGWVIVEKARVSGIPGYIVALKNNPAKHRRAVKMQDILDWISPKAYEDFEFAQYKNQADMEWKRDSEVLTKVAKKKGRKRSTEQVKRHTARAALLTERRRAVEQNVETNTYQSSISHETKSLRGNRSGRRNSKKRKYSTNELLLPIKRRAAIGTSPETQSQEGFLSTSTPSYDPEDYSDEENDQNEGEDKGVPIQTATLRKSFPWSPRPILPLPRSTSSSLSRHTSEPRNYPKILPSTNSIVPKKSCPKPAREPGYDELGTPRRTEVQSPQRQKPPEPSKSLYIKPVAAHSTEYPPILPPRSFLRQSSNPVSATDSRNSSEPRNYPMSESGNNSELPDPSNGSLRKGNKSQTSSRSVSRDLRAAPRMKSLDSTETTNASQMRDIAKFAAEKAPFRRKKGTFKAANSHIPISGSSSKPSKSKLKPKPTSRKKATSKDPPHLVETPYDELNEDQELEEWEVDGILSSVVRPHPITGQPTTHYLISWAGDWDPTWEPEENVSKDAIKTFEAEERKAQSATKRGERGSGGENAKTNGLGGSGADDLDEDDVDEIFREWADNDDGDGVANLGDVLQQWAGNDEEVDLGHSNDGNDLPKAGASHVISRRENPSIEEVDLDNNTPNHDHNSDIDTIDDEEQESGSDLFTDALAQAEADTQIQAESHVLAEAIARDLTELEFEEFEPEDSMFITPEANSRFGPKSISGSDSDSSNFSKGDFERHWDQTIEDFGDEEYPSWGSRSDFNDNGRTSLDM